MRVVNKINLDQPISLLEHGSWKYAENIQISNDGSYSETEDRLVPIRDTFVDNSDYLGNITTPNDIIRFYYLYEEECLIIQLLSTPREHIKILDTRYKNKNIQGTYTYNYKGELIFTLGCVEKDDAPEILIINYNKFKNKVISINSKDYQDILLHPDFFAKKPVIDLIDTFKGGSLDCGVYFISFCYVDENKNTSDFAQLSRPIFINTGNSDHIYSGESFPESVYGLHWSAPSAFFSRTTPKQSKSGLPSGRSIDIKLSNLSENFSKVRIAILEYKDKTLARIALTNEVLYSGTELHYNISTLNGLQTTSLERILVDNIKYVRAKSITSNAGRLLLGNISFDEYYFNKFQKIANNIILKYTNHLRYRSNETPTVDDGYINTYLDGRNTYYHQPFKSGEIYNFYIAFESKKGGYLSVNHIPGKDIKVTKALKSHTTNNTYPDKFPDIAGQNVKFHKFPDANEIYGDVEGKMIAGFRYVLGLEAFNVNIPDELKDQCSGWTIFYSERTGANITKLCEGFVFNRMENPPANPPLNYKVSEFMSFDMYYHKYPSTNIKSITRKFLFFNKVDYRIYSTYLFYDYEQSIMQVSAANAPIHNIKRIKYDSGIDSGIDDTSIKSDRILLYGMQAYGDMEFEYLMLPHGIYEVETTTNKDNLYSDLLNQTLIKSGVFGQANESNKSGYGGDIYYSKFPYRFRFDDGQDNFLTLEYVTLESNYLIEARHEGAEDYQKIYPQTPLPKIVASPMAEDKGSYINDDLGNSYDITHNKLNNIENPFINYDEEETQFKTRIAISDVNSSESSYLGWRIFRPNNYYDITPNKGEIIKLVSAEKLLYIQCKYGLYLAQIKDVLQLADGSQAWLGTGDLFDRSPQEILYQETSGIGCMDFKAAMFSRVGYIVCDKLEGSIYLVGEQVEDITNSGFKNWFKKHIRDEVDNNIIIGFDSFRNRFIISKLDTQFTFSYNILTKGLASFHSYNYLQDICSNSKNTYIFSNTILEFIKEPTNFSSFVDVVFSIDRPVLFQSIVWETQCKIDDEFTYKDTIDYVMIYTDTQCSGLLKVNKANGWYDNSTGRYVQNSWFFNNFFDAVINDNDKFLTDNQPNDNVSKDDKNWFELNQFISKFAVIRLHSDNKNMKRIKFLKVMVEASNDNR